MSGTNQFSTNQGGTGANSGTYSIPEVPTSHFMLKNSKTRSIVVQNVMTKIPPKNGGTFGPLAFMRVEIPSVAWINCDEFGFVFQLNVITDNTTNPPTLLKAPLFERGNVNWQNLRYVSLKNGVQSMINRIKLLWGTSYPAEDIQDYHILMDILRESTATTSWLETVGALYEGVTTGRDWWFHQQMACRLAGLDNYASGVSVFAANTYTQPEFFIRPHLGVLNMGKFIPAGFTGLMTIEFYFNNANYVFLQTLEPSFTLTTRPIAQVNGANPQPAPGPVATPSGYQTTAFTNANASYPNLTYNISNVYFMVSFVSPLEEYNNQVKEKLKSGTKIVLYYETFRQHQRQVPNAWTGDQSFVITERCASLKTVLACFHVQGDHGSWFMPRRYQHIGITQYRVRIGDQYYPQQYVVCDIGGVEPYMELQKAFGQFGDIFSTNNILQWEYRPEDKQVVAMRSLFRKRLSSHHTQFNNKFFLCMNFENSMGQLSGLDTLRMNSDIEFRITFGSKIGTGTSTMDSFYSATAIQNNFRAEVSCIPGLTGPANTLPGPWLIGDVNYADFTSTASLDAAYALLGPTLVVNNTTGGGLQNTTDANFRVGQFYLQLLTVPYQQPSSSSWNWPTYSWVIQPVANNTGNSATNWGTGINDGIVVTGGNTNANSTVTAFDAKYRMLLDTRSWGPIPISWDFYCFTHYDAVMIIETFGAVTFSTDIYNID